MGRDYSDSNGRFHDENGRFVSLRDYVERIWEEKQRGLELAFNNSEKALLAAKEHIENIFDEHRMAHNQKHTDDEKALQQARESINQRLEKLNELRAEVTQDRIGYLTKDKYDSEHSALEARVTIIEDFRAKAIGFGALLALISGAVGAGIAKAVG